MAVSLTDLNLTHIHSDGNKLSKAYQMALSGAYPSGGHLVDNDAFPSQAQVFKKITRVYFESGDNFHDAGYFLKVESIDNADEDEPTFRVRVYEPETGSVAFVEVGTGDTYINSDARIIIEGVKKEGVASEPV